MFINIDSSFCLLTALATLSLKVNAHGVVRKWTITGNGKTEIKEGDDYAPVGTTAQRAFPQQFKDFPNENFQAPTIACNSVATSAADTWPIDPGSIVTAHWSHTGGIDPDTTTGSEIYFASDHFGPVMEYMAACKHDDCNGDVASELEWFKIGEEVQNQGDWAMQTVIETGKWSFKIPEDLKSGAYLVRHEIIAMHGQAGPQSYPACIQVKLGGSGTAFPDSESLAKFPAIYNNYAQDYVAKKNWVADKTIEQFLAGMADVKPPGPPVFGGGESVPQAPTKGIGSAMKNKASLGSPNGIDYGGHAANASAVAAAGAATGAVSYPAPVGSRPALASSPVSSPVTSPVVSPGLVGAADKAEVSPGDKPLAPSGGPKAGSLGSNKAVVLPDPAAPAAPAVSSPAPVSPGATADQDAASNISGGNCIFGHYQCVGTEMQVCQNLAESKIDWVPDHSCPGGCKVEADGVHRECIV